MLCIMNNWKSMKNCPGGFKVGQIMLICNKLERFIYVNNTNCFRCSICSIGPTIYGSAAMRCYY